MTDRKDDRRWPTDRRDNKTSADDQPDMTRERARTERRDLDKERGEPVAGGATRGGDKFVASSIGWLTVVETS